jgi:hypothetical protein
LLNNSIVEKFKQIINTINSHPFVETRYNNFCIISGCIEDIKKQKYAELSHNILLFEQSNNNGYVFTHKFALEDINQGHLNNLHSEFESYLIIFLKDTTFLPTNELNKNNIILSNDYDEAYIITYLNNINCLIHNLEQILHYTGSTAVSGFFSTYLYSEPYVTNISIDDDEFSLFTVESKWGDLLLGYGTTGKSLYHIFKDNDLHLLEKSFNLSPQRVVTSNIMGMFSTTEENHFYSFKKWCIENKLKELYDIDYQDNKNSNGFIKLGELMNTDYEQISQIEHYPNIVGYKIIPSETAESVSYPISGAA